MKTGSTALALLCGLGAVYGSTFFVMPEMVTEYGRPVSYCPYKDVRFAPESAFTDLDGCFHCTCSTFGLSCQTIVGRVSGYPDSSECEAVQIGCENLWVLRNNQNQVCPEDKIPPHGMVGK